MYRLNVSFHRTDFTKGTEAVITCEYNNEGEDINIFKVYKDEQSYTNKITIGPCTHESFLRDRIAEVINGAEKCVLKRRIHNLQGFSVTL